LVARNELIDYFPSYEIITNQAARGVFFEHNQRSVRPEGVAAAMGMFFMSHGMAARPLVSPAGPADAMDEAKRSLTNTADDTAVQCEEAILEAFGR
jgi:hypothetical protein